MNIKERQRRIPKNTIRKADSKETGKIGKMLFRKT
jgi:hypothetical protein